MAKSKTTSIKAACHSVNERVNNSSVQLQIPGEQGNDGNINVSFQNSVADNADFFKPGETYQVSFKKVDSSS